MEKNDDDKDRGWILSGYLAAFALYMAATAVAWGRTQWLWLTYGAAIAAIVCGIRTSWRER